MGKVSTVHPHSLSWSNFAHHSTDVPYKSITIYEACDRPDQPVRYQIWPSIWQQSKENIH